MHPEVACVIIPLLSSLFTVDLSNLLNPAYSSRIGRYHSIQVSPLCLYRIHHYRSFSVSLSGNTAATPFQNISAFGPLVSCNEGLGSDITTNECFNLWRPWSGVLRHGTQAWLDCATFAAAIFSCRPTAAAIPASGWAKFMPSIRQRRANSL